MPETTLNAFSTFGELLKHLRHRARLTQRELGIAVGYSEPHITRLENGQRTPDPNAVKDQFVEALRLSHEPALAARLIELARRAAVLELAAEALPPNSPYRTGGLPTQLTRFIGREHEKAYVKRLLGTTRLLTLTGSGGAGKTRLALEVAATFVGATLAVAPAFPDGVWLVEFAALTENGLVADTVATALGLHAMSRTSSAVLIEFLCDKEALLILDNCEHLIHGCAELTVSLLRNCPRLRLLVTSREPLNVPGEVTWRVPSLAPDEAILLFVERAQAVRPDFTLTAANSPFVTQVCQRLDDMPLAIELAAARLRAFSIAQIATRLNDAFRMLTGGSRMALPRQQTLRATIDWSYHLLADEERALLQQLSVFAGGWTLEAAEAIHGAGALQLLEQLVNKSLVVAERRAEERPPVMRYRLLETIRQYAAEELARTGRDAQRQARQRHMEYFAGLFQTGRSRLAGGSEQSAWLGLLTTEIDNVLTSLSWATQYGDWRTDTQLIESLIWVWNEPGYAAEISRWIDVLILSNPAASDTSRVECMLMSGFMQARRGNIDGCLEWYRRASALAHRLGDENLILNADVKVGAATSDDAESTALLTQVVVFSRQVGRLEFELEATEFIGLRLGLKGSYNQAITELEKGFALAREHQLVLSMASFRWRMGQVYLMMTDYEHARTMLEEAIVLYRGIQDNRAWPLVDLGTVGVYTGDYAPARESLSKTLHYSLNHDNLERIAQGLVLAAGLAHSLGKLERSARLLGAAAAIRRDHHTHGIYECELFAEYDRRLPAVQAAMDLAAFENAWAEGQRLTIKEAIAEALAA